MDKLSVQMYFAFVLVIPRVGELMVKNVTHGEGAVSW